MGLEYCPKCGGLSFTYDARRDAWECLNTKCLIIDYEQKFGNEEGLTRTGRDQCTPRRRPQKSLEGKL